VGRTLTDEHQASMFRRAIWLPNPNNPFSRRRLACSVTNRMDRKAAFVAFL